MISTISVSCGAPVVSDDGDLTTYQCSLLSSTSMSVSADVTAASLSSVQDVSVASLAVTALAGSDIR